MRKFSLSFAFSQSFSQMTQTAVMSITSVLALAGCLLLMGSIGLLRFNVNANMNDLTTEGDAVVFLQADCNEEEIAQMRAILEGYKTTDLLTDYTYVSKEDALRSEMIKFKDYPQLFQSIQTGENPYRPSFAVKLTDADKLPLLIERLQGVSLTRTGEDGVGVPFSPIANVTSHAAAIETVEEVVDGICTVGLWILLALAIVSLFVLMNTVRLAIFSRRNELAVMRYVGATRSFLTVPFWMQGIVLGFSSAGIAFFLQWLLYERFADYLSLRYQPISLLSFGEVWYYLLAAFLFAGLLVGSVGGILATARYLRDKD